MKRYSWILLLVFVLIQSHSNAQKDSSKFELGVTFTPPGIAAENWRKTFTYIPYTINTSRLTSSYEIGASMNYHFSKKWFLNAQLSDYVARLYQYSDQDVALLDPQQEWEHSRTWNVNCHVLSLRSNMNFVLTEKSNYSIQLQSGIILRTPIFQTYTTTIHTTWGNSNELGKSSSSIPFHARIGGASGFSFRYFLTKRFTISFGFSFEYTQSILDRTTIWGAPESLDNHMQFAFYIPISMHFKI